MSYHETISALEVALAEYKRAAEKEGLDNMQIMSDLDDVLINSGFNSMEVNEK